MSRLPPNSKITGCTIADGPALAHNNMSAFWTDPNWVLMWKHTTLSALIPETAKRIPRNLLKDREVLRHQMMVDADGKVVGYARWIMPPSAAKGVDDDMWSVWKEAIVPEVSAEVEREVRRVAESAVWKPNDFMDVLDVKVEEISREIRARKDWMRLDYLAVHPDSKGQGIATALVESGMREAEKLNLDIFILAFEMGKGVYERLGFRIERELLQDDSMFGGPGIWGVWWMLYEQDVEGKTKRERET